MRKFILKGQMVTIEKGKINYYYLTDYEWQWYKNDSLYASGIKKLINTLTAQGYKEY